MPSGKACLTLLLLALAAAAPPRPDPASMIGLTEAELTARLGYPDRRERTAPGQVFITYSDLDVLRAPLSGGVSFSCWTIFVLSEGRVSAFHRKGAGCPH
ncbi:MAG TPA: hypothetical protein VMI52_08810 [Acetobacteraceae bacterium]|nr:hypothetical protein [Acetobacteraceae bacterium]